MGIQNAHNSEQASKTSKLHSVVEAACSSESCAVVDRILQQVDQLSDLEKLLLYLKLPAGKNNDVDPLKIPLNPLGSRFEIQQTIMWIRTHLEEDQDVSMPKHEVYDEYQVYCSTNSMKGLSTADFGKVMKQVFPRVRPRRLGTRGHSRYCYAGLRRKTKLEAPHLPDLDGETPVKAGGEVGASGGSGTGDGSGELAASSLLIRQWAEKLIGEKFETLSQLSSYLVKKNYVSGPTPAGLAGAAAVIKDMPSSYLHPVNRHRETQLQLQRKLQEKELFREQKKKLQDSDGKLEKGGARGRKRKKGLSDEKPDASDDASMDGSAGYGEPPGYGEQYSWLEPAADAFAAPLPQPPEPERGEYAPLPEPACVNMSTMSGGGPVPSAAPTAHSHCPVITSAPHGDTVAHATFVQPAGRQHNGYPPPPPPPPPPPSHVKFKAIQPKFEPGEYDGRASCAGGAEGHREYSDVLCGQDNEEELMQYFNNKDHHQKEELSQLRMLLEQNLPGSKETQKVDKPAGPYGAAAGQNGAGGQSVALRRRVSFQPSLSAPDGLPLPPPGMVPPSPNTRRRYFNFQPIAHEPLPPPPPPGVGESPFVSPHSTPLPLNRSRHNSGQLSAPYLARGPGTGTITPFSAISELSRCATFGSENSTPFLSPQSTPVPFARSRHNSSQQTCRFPQSRSRHSSGATSLVAASLAAAGCRHSQPLYSPMNPNPYSPMSTMAPASPHMSVDESGIQTSNFPTPDGTPSVRSRHSSSGSGISPISAPVSPTSTALVDTRAGYSDLRRRHQSAGATVHYRPPRSVNGAGAPFDALAFEMAGLTDNLDPAASLGLQRSQSVPPTSLAAGGPAASGGYVFRAPPAAISHSSHLAAPLSLEYGLDAFSGAGGGGGGSGGGGGEAPAGCSSNMTLAELNTNLQRPSVSTAGRDGLGLHEQATSVDADLGETLQALSECDEFSQLMMQVPGNE
ncbi:uncharacterized protein LOC119111534 [Pollicipes pollicipes]|uniref:uncharacterized protein LOC119111534 n=1 Tax=Pollicipes pollicipes TaxID=41117 RepID=UPI0018857084|nr:uncharacterized protein LOC119111534 [Pollicipes pollicipes]